MALECWLGHLVPDQISQRPRCSLSGPPLFSSVPWRSFFLCGVLSQRSWLIAWSQTAERDCWAKRDIAESVKEGATREKVRAFGRLAPIATRDAAGLPNRTQRTRHLLEVWPRDEPHPHKLAFTTAKLTQPLAVSASRTGLPRDPGQSAQDSLPSLFNTSPN